MKIVYINNLYPPHARGGAEQVVYQWAHEAKKRGDQSVVISWQPWSGWGSWCPERYEEDGVVVYRYWVPNVCSYANLSKYSFVLKLAWHMIDTFNFWSTAIIKTILKKENPDEVQTHNLMGIGFGIPRMIQRLRIKHTHVFHDVQLVEPSGTLPWNHAKDSLLQKIYSIVMCWRMGKPDRIVSMSEFIKTFYQRRHFFTQCAWRIAKKNVTTYIVKEDRAKRFIYVGTLTKHKGIDVLMRAWQGLRDLPHVSLDIVGDGPLRGGVEKWASADPRVIVHGWLSRAALTLVYAQSDTLLFPSVCLENRPTVLLEANHHNLFVIAADTGGVREFLSSNISVLIEPNDPGVLQEAIEKRI